MAKNRMDRKELRQPDEFITATTRALEWTRENATTVMIAGAVLLAVFLGVVFFQSYRAAQLRDSNADLASALATLRNGELQSASTQLEEVSERWPDTTVGPLADILAANALLRAGEADAALEALRALQLDEMPVYLRQQRDLAWANALEAKQDWQAAAEKYAEAAALGGPYTGDALVGQARALENQGDDERARELYRRVVTEYPDRMDRDLLATKAG